MASLAKLSKSPKKPGFVPHPTFFPLPVFRHVKSHLNECPDTTLRLFQQKPRKDRRQEEEPSRKIRENPNLLTPGDIVQVDSYTTLTSEKRKLTSFAGIILKIHGEGLHQRVLLRNLIMKTTIEQSIQVYSPMVHSIHVIKKRSELKNIPRNTEMLRKDKKFNWSIIQTLVKEYNIKKQEQQHHDQQQRGQQRKT